MAVFLRMRPILALDLGTTAIKAVLSDERGDLVARVERRVSSSGGATFDAEAAIAAAASAVRAVAGACGGRPAAVALSAAMHTLVPIDACGRPLAPARTWADARGAAVARELRAGGRWRGLQERTGTPVDASSPMCALAAIRRQERGLFARAAAFVSLKELLLRRWFDADVVDASLASATGLWDARAQAWDREALSVAGIGPERLSRVVPTTTILGEWRAGVAADLGLASSVPLCVGASDGALANLGSGADDPRTIAATLGTSGAARRTVAAEARWPDASSGLFRYVIDATRHVEGGAVNDAGSALAWAAGVLWPEVESRDRVATLLRAARRSEPGARGVTFDARVRGERFPGYDADARGGFVGLSASTRREDLARAVVEGMVAGVARVVTALARRGPIDVLVLGGGVARDELVRDVLGTTTGRRVEVPRSIEVSALGAARLARAVLQ